MLSIGYELTGEELTALQRLGTGHIAFSLTLACPMRCAHCMVSTVPADEAKRVSLSAGQARKFATEFPKLRGKGVERISMTGGEPLLVPRQLRFLAESAVEAGLECTIVTGCHWAGSIESARQTLTSQPHIRTWHLSADRFHQALLPIEHVVRAAAAAVESERDVLVRMAVTVPPTDEDIRLYERLTEMLPPGVPIAAQRIGKHGRGENLESAIKPSRGTNLPCMTTGMVIQHDGEVSPCCSSLIARRKGHPFKYQSVSETGVCAAYESWLTDPLLRLIRSVGFEPVLAWVREEMADHPVLRSVPCQPCEICTELWRVPGTAAMLRRRTDSPAVRRKVDQLYEAVFSNGVQVGFSVGDEERKK